MQIKNVTLSATTETEITIEQGYPYVWFKNLGDNTVYVSASPDILDNGSVKTEGVSTITSGECTSVTTKSDKVYAYALGATIVEVHAQGNPESSFKIKAKGGESSVTVEPILIKQNGEYTAPEGKAYSPVNVQTPVYTITPLTLTHNHQGADAGLYGGYSPVEVQIEMDTLNAPSNGVYQIDENTQDGWDTVLVDTYEKYNELFFSNANGMTSQGFVKSITEYDDIYIVDYYAYSDGRTNRTHLQSCKYPTDTIYPIVQGRIYGGNNGDDNAYYRWVSFDATGNNAINVAQSNNNAYMYIGINNHDREQDVLWQSTESTTPNTITLTDSIFDYDEICFFMIKPDGATTATWYLTSELQVGDTIKGSDNTHQSAYIIASNNTLTISSENSFRLYTIYGIKDSSIAETTLYTNTSETMPANITLSSAYTNFDELALIGHSGSIKCVQYYPVKAFGKRPSAVDGIVLATDLASSWFNLTSTTTLSVGSTGVFLDKIIGIKRPVISTAHELIDVVPLTANSNGTYTAPTGTAYSPVTVDVQEEPWAPLEDGYSNFWFELTDDTLSPWLNFSAKNADAVIDWGDGSGEQALDTLTPTHTYSKAGRYVVKCKGVTGIDVQHTVPYSGKYLPVLKYAELNDSVTSLVAKAFNYCIGLKDYVFHGTFTGTVGTTVFGECTSLVKTSGFNGKNVIFGSSFTYCFALVDVSLKNGLTTIEGYGFYFCVSLREITIPSTVTSIGTSAFYNCVSLGEVHCKATTPPTLSGSTVFANLPSDFIIYVPVGTGETYKAAAGWSAYSDHILEEGEVVTRAMQRKFEANALKADNSIDGADDESSDKR